MASPSVDIIVPTYNRCALLPEALSSVKTQRFTNWTCWIAEDGETKETLACINSYCQDQRFIYFPGEHCGFPAGPRNRAIQGGKADYIALLDDDDCWLPQKLERQVAFMENNPKCSMVGVNGYRWSGAEQKKRENLGLYHEKIQEGEISLKMLLESNCFIASGVLIRRSSLEKSGPFNTDITPPIGEDYELWLRLAATGTLWFLNTPLLYFREGKRDSHYSKTLTKEQDYQLKAELLRHALSGCNGYQPFCASKDLHQQVENKLHRLKAGPGVFGLLKYLAGKVLP